MSYETFQNQLEHKVILNRVVLSINLVYSTQFAKLPNLSVLLRFVYFFMLSNMIQGALNT